MSPSTLEGARPAVLSARRSETERLHLLSEKTTLERMIAETPEDDVIDRGSLTARLTMVEQALAQLPEAGALLGAIDD